MINRVREEIRHVPSAPGVYLYKDENGNVLYVGKAKDLRKRVRQYFTGGQQVRTALFIPLVHSVDTIVAPSEKEALLLENTLIKRYRPPFNVDLKDDKSYPSFRITVQEEFPRLEITRKLTRDGSLFFGPFADAAAARKTLAWLEKAFPLRRCRRPSPGGRGRQGRPCLDFQMQRCLGPCGEEVSKEQYGRMVQELIQFLRGGGKKVLGSLQKRMQEASEALDYEAAARLRDRVKAIETILEKQDVVGAPEDDMDVMGFARSGDTGVLTCLFIRSGMLVGRSDAVIRSACEPSQALESFIRNHYRDSVPPPPVILCPSMIDFSHAHEQLLSEIAARRTRIRKPSRGRGLRLVKLAEENARQALRELRERDVSAQEVVAQLQKTLKLPGPPFRIECIDISHTSGRETYGATVVWERGRLVKEHFRLYRVEDGSEGGDDYAALSAVIERRLKGSSGTSLPRPDLLLVDGGKGQLSRAAASLRALGLNNLQLAAIAKGRSSAGKEVKSGGDEIYIPGRVNPVKIDRHSREMHLLQMIRDEAHRFVLSSHRRKRTREDLLSRLDGIPGIGPVRRKALLNHFRSIEEIRIAPVEEIASIGGLNLTVARRVKEKLA